jgi:hypothetical protein
VRGRGPKPQGCARSIFTPSPCEDEQNDESYEIQHFLITLDPATGKTEVRKFGIDYDAAQVAYAKAENADAERRLNIVLISTDSLATIETTHSSYFTGNGGQLRDLLAEASR